MTFRLVRRIALHGPVRCARSLHTETFGSPNVNTSTINSSEIAHFSRLSSLWWDEHGEFSFLHKMNPIRMQFIREKLLEVSREENGEDVKRAENILEGLDVLDVGCGGGLLSEVSGSLSWSRKL